MLLNIPQKNIHDEITMEQKDEIEKIEIEAKAKYLSFSEITSIILNMSWFSLDQSISSYIIQKIFESLFVYHTDLIRNRDCKKSDRVGNYIVLYCNVYKDNLV